MTKFLLWHVLLAVVWTIAVGDMTLLNLSVGFALAYVALWLGRGVLGTSRYCGFLLRAIKFILFFFWELVMSNLRVARDVLTPKQYMRPGVVALPLEAKTDGEITLLAGLITLTPGTLSLDVSADRKFLYVHSMYIDDPEREKERLKRRFEKRLLEMLR
jgi:multicomponent Na+:H+ antiporter subunit E